MEATQKGILLACKFCKTASTPSTFSQRVEELSQSKESKQEVDRKAGRQLSKKDYDYKDDDELNGDDCSTSSNQWDDLKAEYKLNENTDGLRKRK